MCGASRSRRLKRWRNWRPTVTEATATPFLAFLEAGVEKGGFETDDVLAAMLPLMKQVQAAHQAELVAPLDGVKHLVVAEQGHLMFAPAHVSSPEKNLSKVEALQAPVSRAVKDNTHSRRTTDIDDSSVGVSDLSVG